MTTVHATISRNDYNALYTRLEQVMGPADGTVLYGWGQTMNAAGVSEGQKVSVEEYGRLITDMYNAYRHIYGSNPPTNWGSWPNDISASQKIKANTLTNDGTYNTQPYRRWNDLIIALEAAKYTIPPAAVASSTTHSNAVSPTGTWSTSAQVLVTFTWSSALAARHFFNSGGQIQLTSSFSSISGSAQDASWRSLLQTASTQTFGGQQPAAGVNPNDNGNFYRCTNVYSTPWYTAIASSPYNANYYRLYARTPGVLDNSSGSAYQLEMSAVYNDDHVGLGGPSTSGTPQQGPGTYGPDTVGPGSLYLQTVTRKAVGTINLYPTGSQAFNIETPAVTPGGYVLS
jgi:hypothetical protein